MCKIRVPVRKTGKEREEERKEECGGMEREREREGERERERGRERKGVCVGGGEGGFWTCYSAMAV